MFWVRKNTQRHQALGCAPVPSLSCPRALGGLCAKRSRSRQACRSRTHIRNLGMYSCFLLQPLWRSNYLNTTCRQHFFMRLALLAPALACGPGFRIAVKDRRWAPPPPCAPVPSLSCPRALGGGASGGYWLPQSHTSQAIHCAIGVSFSQYATPSHTQCSQCSAFAN